MKKIFYICTKPIENWSIFTPLASGDTAQSHISVLLLHKEQNLENVYVAQVWNLSGSEQDKGNENTQNKISYQDFLEQVFFHDLSVVI